MLKYPVAIVCLIMSPILYADITLYTCEQNGVAILTDKPLEHCENQYSFTYGQVNQVNDSLQSANSQDLQNIKDSGI